MKTIRVRNPEGVDLADSYFLHDPDIEHEDFIAELKTGLVHNLQNVLFLQTWDFEKEKLIAFILAVNIPNQKHVYIHQAWNDPENSTKAVIDSLLQRVILWTENFGKTKIRMETLREPDAMARRFGFKKYSTIMELVTENAFDPSLEESEIEDGKEQQGRVEPSDVLDAKPGTTESARTTSTVLPAKSVSESSNIRSKLAVKSNVQPNKDSVGTPIKHPRTE